MKRILLPALILFFNVAHSQNVGIGTGSPAAKLDISSTNSGVLIPRVALTSTTDQSTVPNAATSTLVYNTTTAGTGATAVVPGFYYWNGSANIWVLFVDNNSLAVSTTVSNTSGANTLSTTVNGVTGATVPIVNSISDASSGNTLSTTVNGQSSTGAPIINTNVLSQNGSNQLVSTINNQASNAQTLSVAGDVTGNLGASTVVNIQGTPVTLSSLSDANLLQYSGSSNDWVNVTPASVLGNATTVSNISSANTLSTTVNGVTGATVPIVNSISNTSSANTLSTTVNGAVGSTVPIINTNALSLSGNNLSSTINGIGSSAQSLSGLTLTGDVTGTLGANTLSNIHGVAVSATAPSSTQVLTYNGTNWAPATPTTGTVTGVSVVSANGLAGTVANSSTAPAITLSTTATGMLTGNGTTISGLTGNQYGASYWATANTIGSTAVGATNTVLHGNTGAAPTYSAVSLTGDVSGILPAANGGTGVNNAGTLTNASNTTITGGGTLGLGGYTLTVPATGTAAEGTGTTNYPAYWSGTNTLAAEQYISTAQGGMGANMTAGAIGAIPYAASTTAYVTLAAVAAGSYLRSAGTGTAPVWSTLTLPNAATAGDIFYATGSNAMGNLADVATGSFLTSGGTGTAPAWTPASSTTAGFNSWTEVTTASTPAIISNNQYITGYAGIGSTTNGGDGSFNFGSSTYSPTAPLTVVYPTAATAASTPVATALRLGSPGTSGSKYPVMADFQIGSYGTSGANAQTQLSLKMSNGAVGAPDVTVLTALATGNVGIGTTDVLTTYPQSSSRLYILGPTQTTNLSAAALKIEQALVDFGSTNDYGPAMLFNTNNGTNAWNCGAISGVIGVPGNNGNYPGGLAFSTKAADGTTTGVPAERMRITSAGAVGIGTSSPAYSVDITNSSNTVSNIGLTSGTSSTNSQLTQNIQFNNWYGGSETTSQLVYDFYGSYFSNASHGFSIVSGRSGLDNIWFRNATGGIMGGFMNTTYGVTPTLVSTDNFIVGGNVGIDITAPIATLDVLGGVNTRTGTALSFTPSVYFTGNLASGTTGPAAGNIEFRHYNQTQGIGFGYQTIYATGSSTTTTSQPLNLLSQGSAPITLNAFPYSSGGVGIGTSSPVGALQVKGYYSTTAPVSGSSSANYDISNRIYLTNNSSDYGRTNLILTGRIQGGNDAWSFGSGARNSIVFAENAATSGNNVGATGTEEYSIQLNGVAPTGGTAYSLGFLSATNGATPVMVLQQGGNVGIGTSAPNCPLHVSTAISTGYTTANLARCYFNSGSGGISCQTSQSGNIMIEADGYYWANGGGYVATSDARIKNISGKTDNAADLNTIDKIEITNYKYKDAVTNGDKPQKKVIAQQVKEIYPQAITQREGIIPSVYDTAKCVTLSGSGTVIETIKPHDFKTGDEVKLILEKTGEKTLPVTVVDAHTFSVAVPIDERVFVYGKKVNDLLTVDYDAISMLNVSATQELYRIIKAQQEKIEVLEAENKQLKSSSASKEDLDKLKASIETMQQIIGSRSEK